MNIVEIPGERKGEIPSLFIDQDYKAYDRENHAVWEQLFNRRIGELIFSLGEGEYSLNSKDRDRRDFDLDQVISLDFGIDIYQQLYDAVGQYRIR